MPCLTEEKFPLELPSHDRRRAAVLFHSATHRQMTAERACDLASFPRNRKFIESAMEMDLAPRTFISRGGGPPAIRGDDYACVRRSAADPGARHKGRSTK